MLNKLVEIVNLKSKKSHFFLIITFFIFSFIEIYAEFINDIRLQWVSKPFLIPILIIIYSIAAKKASYLYVIALLFNWFANLLFISSNVKLTLLASISFLIYRILIIIKIFKDEKSLGFIPVIIGSIPFLFLFLSLINIVYDNINGGGFYLIIFQTILMTILGGFSLGNYVIKNDVFSKLLLMSSLFFGINFVVLGIKFYFFNYEFLKPFSMIFFILGHYIFNYLMILKGKKLNF